MRAAFVIGLFVALFSVVLALPTSNSKRGTNGRITFYTGDMLNAPACGGPAPTDEDMICAVPENSGHECGDRINLWHNGKTVTVTVRDKCATCTEPNWFDLSKGAFSKLADLDLGIVDDIVFWKDF
ncbi:hypothetical protein MCUN1_003064 [Malassezia cuniculi]|uniref:RlpA-like protein double-psi beta-barrel domain-containing protein n=1 Tax=Malassezia cuniculi TaxID=948313 RepID=A0AAF0F0S0_9BASI|nr:hypothetical protein MCUN1_003064 [Malassezia cuniculi]